MCERKYNEAIKLIKFSWLGALSHFREYFLYGISFHFASRQQPAATAAKRCDSELTLWIKVEEIKKENIGKLFLLLDSTPISL